MPYRTNEELPEAVRRLPAQAQTIYRAAFNSALEQYHDEGRAHATAWAAVKQKYRQNEDGEWVAKGRLAKLLSGLKKLDDDEADAILEALEESEGAVERTSSGFGKSVEIAKVDESNNTVFGWANVAAIRKEDGSLEIVTDRQGDEIDPVELEEATYVFNLVFREGDEMHTEDVKALLIESFVPTDDKLEALAKIDGPDKPANPEALKWLRKVFPVGAWMGWYVPDDAVFAKVKDGTYRMFSIGGIGVREKVDA